MSRYIDADRLIFKMYNSSNMDGENRATMCRLIQEVPTANVAPKKEMIKEEMINELIKEISDRVIQALEANYEIIPRKPTLRCKDCDNWTSLNGREGICQVWSDFGISHYRYTPKDGYCSEGEMRTE